MYFEESRIGMAGLTKVGSLLKKLDSPELLSFQTSYDSIQMPERGIEVKIHKASGVKSVFVKHLAPFHTIEDLQRALWLQENKGSEVYPKYNYLAFEDGSSLIPAAIDYYTLTENTIERIELPNPEELISSGKLLNEFVDENGQKKIVNFNIRGRSTLESIFLKEFGAFPVFHTFSLSYLMSRYQGVKPISQSGWNGLFSPFFPTLTNADTGSLREEDIKHAKQMEIYIKAKLSQVSLLEDIYEADIKVEPIRTTSVKQIVFQWCNKEREDIFPGVDTLFFSIPVDERKPFIRLLTPNTTPMTKLYQPDPLKPPVIHDPLLLKSWVSEPAPISNESVLYVKALLRKEDTTQKSLYGTLRVLDDTTADFTIQPSKDQRVLDFRKDFALLESALNHVSIGMPFSMQDILLGRANISLEVRFSELPPKNIRRIISDRMKILNTLFQPIESPGEERPFLTYRYKGVSNFMTSDRITSYILYLKNRFGEGSIKLEELVPDLVREFDISEDEASRYIQDSFNNLNEVVLTDVEGKLCQVANHPGVDLSIYSVDVRTFRIQLYNIRSIDLLDIERICTALRFVLFCSEDDWSTFVQKQGLLKKTAEKIQEATEDVEQEDREEEDIAEIQAKPTSPTRNNVFDFGLELEEEENLMEENLAVAPPVAPATEKPVEKKIQPLDSDTSEKIISHQWYIRRLEQLDKKLFYYPLTNPGQRHYSSRCGHTEGRLPVILTENQFNTMKQIYSKEAPNKLINYAKDVGIIIYGDRNTEKSIKESVGKKDSITVMRYGSDTDNLHYFLCHPIFCLKDMLPIIKEDWLRDVDYDGNSKPPESCPFCQGRLIKDPKKPQPGETILIRKDKPKDKKPHSHIGFLANPDHPSGYELPCCFIKKTDIDYTDIRFKAIRERDLQLSQQKPALLEEEKKNQPKSEEADAEKETLEDCLKGPSSFIVAYEELRWKIGREYVLGPEKYPVDPGKIGLPSRELDAFLGQDSSEFVGRAAIKREFKSNAHGFFRMGTLNRVSCIRQSLFAAIAPMLGLNTLVEVADYFAEMITPRVFLNLNFGNLLLEFFDPSDPNYPVQTDDVLSNWAKNQLLTNHLDLTRFEISRWYRSYHRFIDYLYDPNQRKQLRHFAHFLAEPKLDSIESKSTRGGLTIVVLHYKGDPRQATTDIEILCPMMGFDTNRYGPNMVGFLTFSDAGIYEPLVYVDKITETSTSRSEAHYAVTQQQMQQQTFPQVVRERYVDEFVTKCRSAYRGAYTFQSGIDNRVLLPVGRALEILKATGIQPIGIVRDSYNHLVALTIRNPKEGKYDEILLPIVDDGESFINKLSLKIYLNLKAISYASAEDTYSFYEKYITPNMFPISNIYKIDGFLQTSKIVGFRLGGKESSATLILPCGASRQGDETLPAELIQSVDEARKKDDDFLFEYMLNQEIIMDPKDNYKSEGDSEYILQKKQVDTLYEHLRLSFSTWIATMESSQSRKFINDLVKEEPWIRKPYIPNYEKKRRLEIEFGPILRSWFVSDAEPIDFKSILLRNDCISFKDDASKCTGICKFSNGECKIHTPTDIQVRSNPRPTRVSAASYFIDRLLDEIIRIPAQRHELLTKGVKKIQVPSANIHIGSQWILPENVPAWYELLRQKTETLRDEPEYYEEFSRSGTTEQELEKLDTTRSIYPVPESLLAELPPEAKSKLAVQVIGQKEKSKVSAILRYFGIRRDESLPDASSLAPLLVSQIVEKYKIPLIQVLVTQETIQPLGRSVAGKVLPTSVAFVLLPDFEEGPGILVLKDDVTDTIPANLLKGKLYNSIESSAEVPIRRLKLAK
jgi:hypothetical protein